MAYRSDREQGQPSERPRRYSLFCRMGPGSRIPSGPAVSNKAASTGRTEDCTRPTPHDQFCACNAGAIHRGRLPTRATKKPRRFGQGFLETYVGTYVSRIMRTERAILNFSCCALSIRSHQIQVTSSAKSPVQELPQPQMQHCRQRRRFANPGFLAI